MGRRVDRIVHDLADPFGKVRFFSSGRHHKFSDKRDEPYNDPFPFAARRSNRKKIFFLPIDRVVYNPPQTAR
jgi:hypothetical protein